MTVSAKPKAPSHRRASAAHPTGRVRTHQAENPATPAPAASPPAALPPSPDELEAFSYSASHEMRAPLQIIRGFADAILADTENTLSEDSRAYLERIRHSASRIDATVTGLLSYARLGRENVAFKNVILEPLLADVLLQHGPLIAESGAEVTVAPQMPDVYAEPDVLFQAISNLVSNALKFTGSGKVPWIRVSAQSEGEKVRILIEDRGIGIAPQNLGRIFRLFERLNSQSSYPGTGVGLSLVRRAVERIGGHVGVESELGTGSKFWIDLPGAMAAGVTAAATP